MEQAATDTLADQLSKLGTAGIILAVLIAGAVWYLKASKDLRQEKRDVITDLNAEVTSLKAEIKELTLERDRLKRELLDCQYPGRLGNT